jgi:ethanolamine utilization protein EutA (predicted chaperonin)
MIQDKLLSGFSLTEDDLSTPKKKILTEKLIKKDYDFQFFNIFAQTLFRLSYSKDSRKIIFNID